MTTSLLVIALLLGVVLFAAGAVGLRPGPEKGKLIRLAPGIRATLILVGLMLIVGGWVYSRGWFEPRKTPPPPTQQAESQSGAPVLTLWNEADVAERERRLRATVTPATIVPTAPAAAPLPAPTPVAAPAPMPVQAAVRLPVAAPVAVAVTRPTIRGPRRIRNTLRRRPLRGDIYPYPNSNLVSVCRLEYQYGLIPWCPE